MKIDKLNITVEYEVELTNLDVDEKIYKQLKEIYENKSRVIPDQNEYHDTLDWINDNVNQENTEVNYWEYEINELETDD